MANFVGDNGPNSLSGDYFGGTTNFFYGLGGDDSLFGGRGSDYFYGGSGNDRLVGSHGIDYYFYIASYESIYIDEYESSLQNGPTANYFDRLIFYTDAGGGTDPEGLLGRESFGFEFVQDAFFVMPGQTAQSPFGDSLIDTDVLIYTDTGVIHIYDQYGGVDTPDNEQTTDGIEFIWYRWTNFFGSEQTRSFRIADETSVFTGVQTGRANNEFFFGTRGPDTINGSGGDDLIFTGGGDDSAFGGSGVDLFVASGGTNTLDGGNSGDIYYWNDAYAARNVVRESENSSNDELVTNFAVAELGGARLIEAFSTQDGPVLTLELQYRNPASPGQAASSFEIERQIDPGTASRGIEYLRFAGTYYVTQDEFSPDGVNAPSANHNGNDFIVATPDFAGRMRGFDGHDALFGGNRTDRLFGGDGDDLLSGNGGADTLTGGAGDDVLRGGRGPDVLNGGPGSDTADYRFAGVGVNVNLTTGAAKGGPAAGDVLRSIENLVGGAGNDRLIGDGGSNTLEGGFGADVIRGRAGRDEVRGGQGDDKLYGDAGNDAIWGGGGADRAWGAQGRDQVYGGAGGDRIWGGGGGDRLWGGVGQDRVLGGGGADRIWGDGANDRLFGGGGADQLRGGGGADRLVGGPGDDVMWGGGGRDTFVFARNSADDVVRDFRNGVDVLDMSRVASGFADLTLTDTADGLLIEHSGGSVLVAGVQESDLRLQDVAF